MKNDLKIGLLIDAENYLDPESLFEQFADQITQFGSVNKKAAFGGWSYNSRLFTWKELCKISKIEMVSNNFNGKNAADRTLISMGTNLFRKGFINAIAIYSRDTGFALAFAAWKVMGIKIIAPKMGNEFIPDADAYINITRSAKKIQTKSEINKSKLEPITDLGIKLKEVLPNYFL